MCQNIMYQKNMKFSELQEVFLRELGTHFPEWKYVKSQRHFKLKSGDYNWYLHISCVTRTSDFDAVADVAMEIPENRTKVVEIGAELGNIEGVGQRRFSVTSCESAIESARTLKLCFDSIGQPFLRLYSDPEVISFQSAHNRLPDWLRHANLLRRKRVTTKIFKHSKKIFTNLLNLLTIPYFNIRKNRFLKPVQHLFTCNTRHFFILRS